MNTTFQFYEASTLLKIINDNKDLLHTTKIKGIYTTERLEWFEHTPGRKTWTIGSCMIIEFDKFAIGIDYYDASNMKVRVVDSKDSLRPVERVEDLDVVNSAISSVMIERFSREFEISSSGDMVRPEGGDYFHGIIFMAGDIGIRICPEDILFDSTYFDVELINLEDIKELKPLMGGYFEMIEV